MPALDTYRGQLGKQPKTENQQVSDNSGATDWQKHAICRTLSEQDKDNLFFHPSDKDPYKQDRREFCARCPVRKACLDFGNEMSPSYGAFGGYSEVERKLMRRYQEKAPTVEQIRAEA